VKGGHDATENTNPPPGGRAGCRSQHVDERSTARQQPAEPDGQTAERAPATPSTPPTLAESVRRDVEEGNLEAVKRYLAGGGDINAASSSGMTLLHLAASEGHIAMVQYLLDRGADPDTTRRDGHTVVHTAAVMGHTETARLLAARGSPVTDAPAAVAVNNPELLGILAAKDPELVYRTWYTWAWCEEHTLLHHAAHHGSVDCIAALVALGGDPRAKDSCGFTPLMIAAAGGHVEAVRELLKHDDRINLASDYGWTPLNLAAGRGHEAVVRFLLQRGARYDIFTAVARGDLERVQTLVSQDKALLEEEAGGETPLVWAAEHNRPRILQWLLDQGADADFHNGWEDSALGAAAWKGHTAIVKLLLDAGADPEIGAVEDAYGTPLHRACWQGNVELVRMLLDRGADINSEDNDHDTPLCFAAGEGHLDVVAFLLNRGADPNKGSPLGRAVIANRLAVADRLLEAGAAVGTSLNTAADRGYVAMVERLLEADFDRDARDDERRTALHAAVASCRANRVDDYLKIVGLLLDAGFDLHARSHNGCQAIHLASNVRMVAHLLKRGADVNARTTNKAVTPLHLACRAKDMDRVRLLLDHGADPNAVDEDGGTPLHRVVGDTDERSKAIAALLREHGARLDVFAEALSGRTQHVLARLAEAPHLVSVRGRGGQTLLHVAAGRGDLDFVKALLSYGADLETKDGWARWTPLHTAACKGHEAVVDYLIRQGAQVEAPGTYRQGILYTASMQGHAGVVRLLCAAGADVEAKTSWGFTPLHAAAEDGHLEAVKALLDAGADVNRLCKGSTALDAAVEGDHVDVVRLLLARGADLNASRRTYIPALHSAASSGSVGMIRLLLDAGADVNRQNERGDTALDWALSNGKHRAVRVLREAGGVSGRDLTGPERVASLIRQLGDDSYAVREAAEAALRAIAPQVVKRLRDALQKTHDLEREIRLRRILGSLPPE